MLLNVLMKLAQQTDFTIAFHATGADKSRLSIVLMPVSKEGQDPALSHPVKLEGTVEEIDAGFEGAIAKYATARANLTEQIDATVTLLEQAQKTSAAKAAEKIKPGGKAKPPAKAGAAASASSTADDLDEETADDQDQQDEGNDLAPSGAAAATASGQAAVLAGNLFGEAHA